MAYFTGLVSWKCNNRSRSSSKFARNEGKLVNLMLTGLLKVQQLKSILCQGSLVLLTVGSRIVTIRGPVLFLDLHFLCEIVPECCKTIRGYYPSLPNYKAALYTTRHVAKFRIFVENPCTKKILRNGIFPNTIQHNCYESLELES